MQEVVHLVWRECGNAESAMTLQLKRRQPKHDGVNRALQLVDSTFVLAEFADEPREGIAFILLSMLDRLEDEHPALERDRQTGEFEVSTE